MISYTSVFNPEGSGQSFWNALKENGGLDCNGISAVFSVTFSLKKINKLFKFHQSLIIVLISSSIMVAQ